MKREQSRRTETTSITTYSESTERNTKITRCEYIKTRTEQKESTRKRGSRNKSRRA